MGRYFVGMKKGLALVLVGVLLLSNAQNIQAKQKIKISKKKLSLTVGAKKKLKVTNARKVQWKSNNPKIASVNKKGVVTAKKVGTTKIVATVKKKKYTCKVTVKEKQTTSVPAATVPPANPVTQEPVATISPAPTETVSPTPVVSEKPLEPATPTWGPTETADVNPMTQIVWQPGEKSGLEGDYDYYFDVDFKTYTRKQPETIMGSVETITYYSEVVGADREAYVYLPPEYSTEKEYPVLYMIHGLGCDKGQWYSLTLENILSNMISRGEVVPFVAVLPSVVPKDGLGENAHGFESIAAFSVFNQEFSQDLEPYILENYSVSNKPEDTGICGLSMGGMEALDLGFSIKNHFNYIGSFSAAPTLDQSILNLDDWTFAPKVVMLCTGTKDATVGDNPYNYHMSLVKNKVEHIWYQYPGGGHSDPVWKNGLINFLKRSF